MEKSLAERLSKKTNLVEVNEPHYTDEVEKTKSRAEVKRENANAVGADALDSFAHCLEVLGTTDLSHVSFLSPEQINFLTDELIAVRSVKDIAEGRETAIKAYVTNVINLKLANEGKDPSTDSGYLVSSDFNVKLSKEVTGGKLNVDLDLLKTVLEEDQYESVVNHVETSVTTIRPDGSKTVENTKEDVLNEECLEKELKLGNIGMEQILNATIPGKSRTSFYVRPIK